MALFNPSFVAADGPIAPHRFITIVGDNQVNQSQANQRTVGITSPATDQPPLSDLVTTAYAAGSAGDHVSSYGEGECCLLELGGTVVAGDILKSDADGKGVKAANDSSAPQWIGAHALQGGASGNLVMVQKVMFVYTPTATESSTSSSGS